MIHAEIFMKSKNWHIIIARNDHESTTNICLFVITKEIQGLSESILNYESYTFQGELMTTSCKALYKFARILNILHRANILI